MIKFSPKTTLQPALDFVFGYDFFISYSHGDGGNYPKRLQERLQQAGFKVFLDLSNYAAGTDLPTETVRQIRKCQKFLVVARRAALKSKWVAREIDIALSLGKIPVIININSEVEASASNSSISQQAMEREWLLLSEPLDNPDDDPSDSAVGEIVRGFRNMRQETKRLRVLTAAAVILFATTVVAGWQGYVAFKNKERAVASEEIAKANEQLAKANEARAERERDTAITNESQALAALAQAASLRGKHADAVMLAIAAWPRKGDQRRPFLVQTIDALSGALPKLREKARTVGKNSFETVQFLGQSDFFVVQPSRGPLEVWSAKTWTKTTSLGGEDDRISSMDTSDGLISAGMQDGWIRIYDPSSGMLRTSAKAHSEGLKGIVFSPDGQRLATASSDDKTVKIWHTRTLQPVTQSLKVADAFTELAFSPDGQSLAVTYMNGVTIIDANTGAIKRTIVSSDIPTSAVFLDSGDKILITKLVENAEIYEAKSGSHLTSLNRCPEGASKVLLSPDRSRFFLQCHPKGVIYDSKTLNVLTTISGPSVAGKASFSPDNRLLATVALNGSGELWDGMTGQKLGDLAGHTDGILSVNISARGDVVTTSHDNTFRLWGAASSRPRTLGHFGDQDTKDTALWERPSLSTDGRALLFVAAGFIQVLSLEDLKRYDLIANRAIQFARFCRGSDSVVAIEDSGDLLILSSPGNRTIVREAAAARAASCSPKGDILAWGDRQGRIRLLNYTSPDEIRTLGQMYSNARIIDISFSPDGSFVAAATSDSLNIWRSDAAEANPVASISEASIETMQYSPDGVEIAVAGKTGFPTKLIVVENRQTRISLRDRSTIRRAIRFSANGSRLLTPLGNSAVLWDSATGAALASYGPHESDVIWSAFVQNDESILTISKDGETRLWDMLPPRAGDAFYVACQYFRDTKALDQVASAIGVAGLKPICSAGHEPMPFNGAH